MRFRRRNEDLDEEIRAHLAMAIQDRIDRGESPAEAERNARREFGNPVLVKEVTRDMWSWTALERSVKDFRFALRQMRRNPGFSAIAILTLALGIGAVTVMFSIVDGVLLQPLRYRDPGRLYLARTLPPANAKFTGDFPVNAHHYYEWRTHCQACESVSLIQFDELTLVGAGAPAKLAALDVSDNFFRTLGVQPALGRDFLFEEDQAGHFGEVILTDSLWRSRFDSDPAIVGRAIRLNGELYTVAGVMPASLHLPKGDEWGAYFGPSATPQIFRPGAQFYQGGRGRKVGNLNYTSVIRLKPGIPVAQGIGELNALMADYAVTNQLHLETRTTLIPLQDQVTRNARASLWMLLGTVAAVLLIVCVNIGNLMIVRTTSRYREAGVRMALGASRGQLFRLVLEEALALVAAGGAAGLGLAYVGLRLFVASAPVGVPRLEEVGIDWRVLAFCGVAAAFSTVACGLFPAWRLSRIQVQDSLKAGAATSTEGGGKLRLREALVGIEVALSTMLLIAAGLLLLSFVRLMSVDRGFETARVITQDVSYLSPKYAHGARRAVVAETAAKLAALPGVEAAAAINRLPLEGDDWVAELEDPDQPARPTEQAALANFRFVTPDYWKAMGIPLKMGRFLNESDKDQPKAVITEGVARTLWPNQNPLGKRLVGVGSPSPKLEVVGVVGDVRASGLEQNPTRMVYEHYWRMQPIGMSFVLRTQANPRAVAGGIRSILAGADPEMAIPQPVTMEQIVERSVASRRFEMNLAVWFAFAALLLASLGIYGVVSFAVARRTSEIGIRIALGAEGRQLLVMVLRQGMSPVVLGLAGGIGGGLVVSRLRTTQLFGIAPGDPVTIAGAALVLLTVGLFACWIPARRATRIDPLSALRFE